MLPSLKLLYYAGNRQENSDLKSGNIPTEWQKEENKNKLRQKDTDAKWTRENNQNYDTITKVTSYFGGIGYQLSFVRFYKYA